MSEIDSIKDLFIRRSKQAYRYDYAENVVSLNVLNMAIETAFKAGVRSASRYNEDMEYLICLE